MSFTGKVYKRFKELYNDEPVIVRSPGRVNLIGEHTDYNSGFVLPAAVNKAVYAGISKREDDKILLYAAEFDQHFTTDIHTLAPNKERWPDYILGVADQFQKQGLTISGFNMVLDGNVPIGAGMSSSAAVECATAKALSELFAPGLSKLDMVKMAQAAEHEFAGVKCGIMDMFASVFGKKDHVIKLDCRSLEYAYVPFDFDDIAIVLFDTGIKHSLASTEYNVRRQQCEAGVAMIQKHYTGVHSLRDATMEMLDACVKHDAVVYNRCSFIVAEIQRLQDACNDLQHNDISAFGKRMFETHAGLSRLYEVSCPELDVLVESVKNNHAVMGARMMGGGFGGCTINLVKKDMIHTLVHETTAKYKGATGRDLQVYIASIENGTEVMHGLINA
ncbi:galactokinase [Panacibacter sp. DH6]|uniref:Galactokinase n=1 Tax=Panacibacter microcysteis TaxID=2793269 RepID=A0A931E4C9_9BACT|nr:galactokinase [Panacibacter microcysteis]MBG9375050.1 galactokinase [Panacibacter microcysteis]